MAVFHRNAIVIDASGESAFLSPLLLCQSMSQSRLVTSTEGRGWENTSYQRASKFRMTEHNKQIQEVGLQRHLWPLCCFFKTAGKNQSL